MSAINDANPLVMTTLKQVEKLISEAIAPIQLKVNNLEKNYHDLTRSVDLLSNKYDDILNQLVIINKNLKRHDSDISTLKQDIKIVDKRAVEADQQVDDLAQYIRRDCLEIQGVRPTKDHSSEDIVKSVGECIGVKLHSNDIAIAHPIPSYNADLPPKIIVKFTHRKTRNNFYANRRNLNKKKAKDLPHLNLNSQESVFISESLTAKKKRLFGEVNKAKKKLKWRFIWSYNGRIFIKEKENSKTFTFDNEGDIIKFNKTH